MRQVHLGIRLRCASSLGLGTLDVYRGWYRDTGSLTVQYRCVRMCVPLRMLQPIAERCCPVKVWHAPFYDCEGACSYFGALQLL